MGTTPSVPSQRIRRINTAAYQPDGEYVVYWMIAQRRTSWNFALDHALALAVQFQRPLLIFEPLRISYQWANERHHRFIMDGMADNAAACTTAGVTYYPYVETVPDAGTGLLASLAAKACAVVTDHSPAFFYPAMVQAAGQQLKVRLDAVDSIGLVPLTAPGRTFTAAVHFRRFLQAKCQLFLRDMPSADPLTALAGQPAAKIPSAILKRWGQVSPATFANLDAYLAKLPIDHKITGGWARGGPQRALAQWREFHAVRLHAYAEGRNHPDDDLASGLSAYLHFGHISTHQMIREICAAQQWEPSRMQGKANGAKEGWWGLDAAAESFLDELVTWRELAHNHAFMEPRYDQFETLPAWALATLANHARDPREHTYTLAQLTAAKTHDVVWNAAQRQLVREGRMHNYLRMLWGKKVLKWSKDPREAARILIELNNRYALDGRDPNSYAGIFWCFGRFDRAWGPERPVFGSVRYMTSGNTVKKLRMKDYLQRYEADT